MEKLYNKLPFTISKFEGLGWQQRNTEKRKDRAGKSGNKTHNSELDSHNYTWRILYPNNINS